MLAGSYGLPHLLFGPLFESRCTIRHSVFSGRARIDELTAAYDLHERQMGGGCSQLMSQLTEYLSSCIGRESRVQNQA